MQLSLQATRMGFEPTTSAVTGRRSNQLSHRAIIVSNDRRYCVPSELHTDTRLSFPFSKPLRISPRPISTCQLNVLPRLHSKPINLVVFKGSYSNDGISYLEGGFTLRCLQRLSLPDLATLPCCWYNNRYTSGPSIPVLSY